MFWFALSIQYFKTNNLVEYPSHKLCRSPSKRCNLRLRSGSICASWAPCCSVHMPSRMQTSPVITHISEISVWRIRNSHFTRSTVTLLLSAADAAAPCLAALNVWPFPSGSAHLALPGEVEKVENASLILHCARVEHNESQQWQAVTFSGMHAKYAATLTRQAGKQRHFLR